MKPTKTQIAPVPGPNDQVRILITEMHKEEIPERLLELARTLQDALDDRDGAKK